MRGRSVFRKSVGLPKTSLFVLPLLAATALSAQHVHPTPVRPSPTVGTGISNNPNRGYAPYGADISEGDQQGEILRAHARAEERQRRMVEDANRLVVLTAQYRASVTEHRGATAEDSKLLVNIEKLARSVKDRMRGQ